MSTTDTTISVKDISKQYLLYSRPQDRLKQSLFWRLGKNYAQTFWALHNISFDVARGETVGIIGRNGSGKSTLLQIIAGTLQPTSGSIEVKGRLTALLELGAGFNPEFTGRENIFLNGATLGIPEKEMKQRLDEIIDFAQIGVFIDQPVKIYSSGMYVRLAFAIATSVNPQILVIDEALAVGDTGFVMKCTNRMKKMRENGTTILLVTHDVQTVRSLCDRAVWLDQGNLKQIGAPIDVTSQYLQSLFADQPADVLPSQAQEYKEKPRATDANFFTESALIHLKDKPDLVRWGSGEIRIESCEMRSEDTSEGFAFEYGKRLYIRVHIRAFTDLSTRQLGVGFAFRDLHGLDIITTTTLDEKNAIPPLRAGQGVTISFEIDNLLRPGDYALVLNIEDRDEAVPHYYDFIEDAILFKVLSEKPIFSLVLPPVNQTITVEP